MGVDSGAAGTAPDGGPPEAGGPDTALRLALGVHWFLMHATRMSGSAIASQLQGCAPTSDSVPSMNTVTTAALNVHRAMATSLYSIIQRN
jgi:hypothetical protein